MDKVFDLFSELGATDAQMDFQIVYASGRAVLSDRFITDTYVAVVSHHNYCNFPLHSGMNGIAGIEPDKLTENLQPLFQEILKLPKAQVSLNLMRCAIKIGGLPSVPMFTKHQHEISSFDLSSSYLRVNIFPLTRWTRTTLFKCLSPT